MMIKKTLKKVLKSIGVQIKRYPDLDLERRMLIVNRNNINIILDIGANIGQYALSMRELGYKRRIVSFEPLKSAFKELKIASAQDNNWDVNNFALGSDDTTSVINVAANSYSSSILNILPLHLNIAIESKSIAKEEIVVRRLDSIFNSYCKEDDRVMMKIDTQGYEKKVIEGAIQSLKNIHIIQLEMSIVPLYEDEMLYMDMILNLQKKGFLLLSIENGFTDPVTGQLLQFDGIFVNQLYR